MSTAAWPRRCDSDPIRYLAGARIAPHTDPVQAGRHYRLNLVLKAAPAGGECMRKSPIHASRRSKPCRPDRCGYSVTLAAGGSRHVRSIGWAPDDVNAGQRA